MIIGFSDQLTLYSTIFKMQMITCILLTCHFCIFRRPCHTRVAEPAYYNSSASTPVAVITPVQHGKQQQTLDANVYEYTTVNTQFQLTSEGDDNNLYDMPSSPVYADSHDMFPNDSDVSTTTNIPDGVDDDTTITDNHVYCKYTEDEQVYDKDGDDVTIVDNSMYNQDIEVTGVKGEDEVTIVDNVVYGQNCNDGD